MPLNPRYSIMMTRQPACAALGAFLLLAATPASAASTTELYQRNWPQWRGPAGNGLVLHGNPPLEWGEDKNVRWKVAIPGQGHATPIIWENRIFILTAVPEPGQQASAAVRVPAGQVQPPAGGGESRRGGGGRGFGGRSQPAQPQAFMVMCLDRRSGKTLWEKVARRDTPQPGLQPSNTHSSGSPVTDGERVYASFGSHGLYCYDFAGNQVWQKDLGKVDVTFGEGSSPALAHGILVVVQDNNGPSFVYAFDAATGKEVWKQPRDERSGWTTPYIFEHSGKTQVVINGSRAVRSYDLRTGELLWQCGGLGSNPVPMIVADDRAVYAMSGHQSPTGLAIKLGGSGDLTGTDHVLWRVTDITPYVPSPLLYGGLLYFPKRTSQMLSCLDAATGKPHFTEERLEAIAGIYASPIGVQGRIYIPGQNGATTVLERSTTLKILATNRLDDAFDASPAVVGNELFLRGRRNLYCLAAN